MPRLTLYIHSHTAKCSPWTILLHLENFFTFAATHSSTQTQKVVTNLWLLWTMQTVTALTVTFTSERKLCAPQRVSRSTKKLCIDRTSRRLLVLLISIMYCFQFYCVRYNLQHFHSRTHKKVHKQLMHILSELHSHLLVKSEQIHWDCREFATNCSKTQIEKCQSRSLTRVIAFHLLSFNM